MLPRPDLIITIHGVGEHEPGQVGLELAKVWGSSGMFPVIDFNWCTTVESYKRDRIRELSFSIASAEGYTPVRNAFLRACVGLNDLCWGITFLALTVCPLLLMPLVVSCLNLPDFSIVESGWPAAMVQSLRWLLIASGASTLVLLVLSSVFALMKQRPAFWWLLRVSLLAVTRPVLTLLFWFASLSQVARSLGRAGLWLIGLSIGSLLFGELISWLFSLGHWDWFYYYQFYLYFSFGCSGLLVLSLTLALLSRMLSFPLKFCRDVFNYLADTSTRTRIQEALDEAVGKIPRGSNVAVLSHSLGSVIAVDSMTTRDAWAHLGSVVLVTAGSPIWRWFQRFFPRMLFSDHTDDMLGQIRARNPLVGWINIFREHDPVGAALGFSALCPGVDQGTNEPHLRGLAAHAGYWKSERVHEVVRERWRDTEPLPGPQGPAAAMGWPTTSMLPEGTKLIASLASPTILGTAVVAVVFSLALYFQTISHIGIRAKEFVAEALTSGHRVPARVTHQQFWRDMGSMGDNSSIPVQRYVFEYKTVDGQPRESFDITEIEGNPIQCCLLFDSERLRKDFRSGDDLDVAKTFSVTIAYLDNDQSRIAVPAYPPTLDRVPWWDVAGGVIPQLLYTAFFGLMALFLTKIIADLLVVLVP